MAEVAASLPSFASDRFETRTLLGRGAFGSVYEVEDRSTGVQLALKVLDRTQPWALYRFKTEFRVLTQLHHPNLVRLYELHHEPQHERWMFTMELVEGVDPLAALGVMAADEAQTLPTADATGEFDQQSTRGQVADAPPAPLRRADPAAVRAVFGGIARGVHALHRAGVLHRDLKPQNVLVNSEGAVKVLDFGLIALLDQPSERGQIAGTLDYMAPERLRGEAATPASDWFALGVMLHQALTGRLPPRDTPASGLLADERGALPQLCRALLQVREEDRPAPAEVLATLGVEVEPDTDEGKRLGHFVGREAELERLSACFDHSRGGPVVAWIVGRSGVGKSALGERLLVELRAEHEALVASGRCFAQEQLGLKAIDGVVDALGSVLRDAYSDRDFELKTEQIQALCVLFPVLGATLDPEGARATSKLELEPREIRRRAVLALAQILATIASERPLVLHIDDLQWGDAASAEVLAQLLAREVPMLVLGTCRREELAESAFMSRFEVLAPAVKIERIDLDPLAIDQCRRLAAELLDRDDAEPRVLEAIARESGGSPLFVEELVTQRKSQPAPVAATSLQALIDGRVAALEPTDRDVLELVAVAGQPTPRSLILDCVEAEQPGWHALDSLRGNRLVRIRDPGSHGLAIESYHDRIRETVLTGLDERRRACLELRLAEAMVAAAFEDRGRIARHFVGAGEGARAVPFAIEAAKHASETLAFERAAEFYALALAELSADAPERAELCERRADALVQAGRCAEAAQIYEDLAPEHADPAALLNKAAEQWMTSGHHERGAELLRDLLTDYGLPWPRSDGSALLRTMAAMARLRVRPLALRSNAEPSADTRRRLELCLSASRGLQAHDFARSSYYLLRAAVESRDVGDRHRAVRSYSGAAMSLRIMGVGFGDRLYAEARRTADELGEPYLDATIEANDAYVKMNLGDYAGALAQIEPTLPRFEDECVAATWEVSITRAMLCDCYYMVGDYTRLAQLAPESYARAQGIGDQQAIFAAGLYYAASMLATARDEEAEQALLATSTTLASEFTYGMPRALCAMFLSECELYRGRVHDAWQRFEAEWPAFRGSGLYWAGYFRSRMLAVRATLIAAALDAHAAKRGRDLPTPKALRELGSRCARGLRRAGQPWAEAEASRLEAALAHADDAHIRACERLKRAQSAFDGLGMTLRACMCRARAAQLADEPGVVTEALSEMQARGVHVPERWLDAFAPGFA